MIDAGSLPHEVFFKLSFEYFMYPTVEVKNVSSSVKGGWTPDELLITEIDQEN